MKEVRELVFELNNPEDGWNRLGSFHFPADSVTIRLTNQTDGRRVIADAVKWVKKVDEVKMLEVMRMTTGKYDEGNERIAGMVMLWCPDLWEQHFRAQALLTIDRSMEIAVENSPDMKQTELSLVRSQERLNAQRARLKSQFSITLDPFEYEKTNRFDQQTSEWYLNESASSGGTFAINQRILPTDGELMLVNRFSYDYSFTESAFASDPLSKTFNNRLYLQFTQPIFTYNRTRMETEKLELDYEASLISYLLMQLTLERNVAQEFYAVYSNQMSLEIAREDLKNNEESYEIIKNKVEGGLLALEELYQAEVNLATSRSGVFNAELTLANSMDQFKVLIGLPLDTTILIAAEIMADTVPVNQELAISHALENRMELREREIDMENANFDLIVAKSTNEFAGSSHGFLRGTGK